MMDCEGDVITMVDNNNDSGGTYSIYYRQGDNDVIQMVVNNNNKTGLNVKSDEMAHYI